MMKITAIWLMLITCLCGIAKGEEKPRNVLFIAVDDLRPQLGCYGEAWMKTPNIDKLAAGGMRFDRHYVQFAVCIPSRVSLLTSLRSERTHQLYGPLVWHETDGSKGVGRWFSEQGYRTISFGKIWHLHDGTNEDRFDESYGVGGPDYVLPENLRSKEESKVAGIAPAGEAADVDDDAYRDGKIATAAIERLRRLKSSDKPFLMAVGFLKPHLPFCAPKKYWDLYDPAAVPLAEQPNFPINSPAQARNYGIPDYRDTPKGGGRETPIPEPVARHLIHGYAACTSYVDAQVGRVLDELKRLQLDKNTIVVLWGDHGWFLGDVGQWHKHSNFERATRSPLIVAGLGVLSGGACDRFVETVDVFPTLLDCLGLKPFPLSDGRSFKPLLTDPTLPWKECAFHVYNRGKIIGYAVRTSDARYVEWHQGWGLETPIVAREFYRYSAEQRDEIMNEVDDSSLATEVHRHSALLRTPEK